jgi:hypothetical protein
MLSLEANSIESQECLELFMTGGSSLYDVMCTLLANTAAPYVKQALRFSATNRD